MIILLRRAAAHSVQGANLADLSERVLDKGVVIVGDVPAFTRGGKGAMSADSLVGMEQRLSRLEASRLEPKSYSEH